MSPIDVLGQQLFFMHMIQHLLLIMVAPVLTVSQPNAFSIVGLPARARLAAGSALNLSFQAIDYWPFAGDGPPCPPSSGLA